MRGSESSAYARTYVRTYHPDKSQMSVRPQGVHSKYVAARFARNN